MTSKVNPNVAGSGRGSSDAAIQSNFAIISKELSALQDNAGGTRSSMVVHFGAVASQGDTLAVARKGISRLYEFSNTTLATGGLKVNLGTDGPSQANNLASAINNDKGIHLEVSWLAFVVGSDCYILARDDDSDAFTMGTGFTSGANTGAITNTGSKSGNATGKRASFSHTPVASEVTAGKVVIWLNWAPSVVVVLAYTKSTHAKLAWDGAWSVLVTAPDTAMLTIDNSGATDWTVNELLIVEAYG
jgi:hypothetical protein